MEIRINIPKNASVEEILRATLDACQCDGFMNENTGCFCQIGDICVESGIDASLMSSCKMAHKKFCETCERCDECTLSNEDFCMVSEN